MNDDYERICKKIRTRHRICVILGICLAVVFTGMAAARSAQVQAAVEATQKDLAGQVFRFHVLANSDSCEDQEVKLKVRDAVLAFLEEGMSGEDLDGAGAEATEAWTGAHLDEIEAVAEETLAQEGYSYGARAEVTTCAFPDKRYGDLMFPAGNYRALRICLGDAQGQNWWCVLYPNLCFTSAVCAVVDEEGKEELKDALTAEEYEMITASSKFKIKWFFFGEIFEDGSKKPGGSHDD